MIDAALIQNSRQFITSRMQIQLMRNIPNTKLSIKQPSTGKEYQVFGGYSEWTIIEAIKIK
jgi:hypothetical protein